MSSNNNSSLNFGQDEDQPSSRNLNPWPPKKNSSKFPQPSTTTTAVIPTFPAGYPDQFYPDPVSFSNRHPTRRMLFESQMTALISNVFLQIEDVTVFSSLRKDVFWSVTGLNGNDVLLARKIRKGHFQLPLYSLNPTIIQNGFSVNVKNLGGATVLSFKRKTLQNSKEVDIMHVWLGDEIIPIGQITKPALINEYKIFDEFNNPLFFINKAQSMTDPKDVKKRYKYVIHSVGEGQIVGQINCRGRKRFGQSGEHPSTEFRRDLTITQKSLVLGALFFIASRAHSGIEGDEEKTREKLKISDSTCLTSLTG